MKKAQAMADISLNLRLSWHLSPKCLSLQPLLSPSVFSSLPHIYNLIEFGQTDIFNHLSNLDDTSQEIQSYTGGGTHLHRGQFLVACCKVPKMFSTCIDGSLKNLNSTKCSGVWPHRKEHSPGKSCALDTVQAQPSTPEWLYPPEADSPSCSRGINSPRMEAHLSLQQQAESKAQGTLKR